MFTLGTDPLDENGDSITEDSQPKKCFCRICGHCLSGSDYCDYCNEIGAE